MNKILPLIFYWKFYRKQTSTLNDDIALTTFANTINSGAGKNLQEKLSDGSQLELTVEKLPSSFSLVSKDHVVWVVYPFSWSKVYMQPDTTNLVVYYKLTGFQTKTGSITVKNPLSNQNLLFLQSWKSAAAQQISDYNAALVRMTRDFMNQLVQKLQARYNTDGLIFATRLALTVLIAHGDT